MNSRTNSVEPTEPGACSSPSWGHAPGTSKASGNRSRQKLTCVSSEHDVEPDLDAPISTRKKGKSGFRLPGKKKKHRKELQAQQQQEAPSVPPTTVEATTIITDLDVSSKQNRKPDKAEASHKQTKSMSRVTKELSGLGLLSKEARKSKRKRNAAASASAVGSAGFPAKSTPAPKPVFGVPLSVAIERDPSHDGVPLPAFFRHCMQYIEEYGLSTEGIYRVPGVNSQIQVLVNTLDRGEDFLQIAPTSAAYYQHQPPPSHDWSTRLSQQWNSAYSDLGSKNKPMRTGSRHVTRVSANSPTRSRVRNDANTSIGSVPFSATPELPHDLSVVASVLKHFVRNLTEPVLTTALRPVIEAIPAMFNPPGSVEMYETLARVVHQRLPLPHRFLLAWLLQHMRHIIDRSGENLMTLANISIVLSPCVGMSHRLLAVLLSPPMPADFRIDLAQLDPSLPPLSRGHEAGQDPSIWHWLFPHPVYLLRPYRPPLKPGPQLELPETDVELDAELHKQESLLLHLHGQIGSGETSEEKERMIWEIQQLVTELRRRKSLTDPEVIRMELSRQQSLLDKLHEAMTTEQTMMMRPTSPGIPGGPGAPSSMKTGGSSMQAAASTTPTPNSGIQSVTGTGETKRRGLFFGKHRPEPTTSSYSDQLWEVQRQITMLKRRLKNQERLKERQQLPQQSSLEGPGLSGRDQMSVQRQIVMSGPIPLVIPSVSELDQEEVLNLTLRKLSVDESLALVKETDVTITETPDPVSTPTRVTPPTELTAVVESTIVETPPPVIESKCVSTECISQNEIMLDNQEEPQNEVLILEDKTASSVPGVDEIEQNDLDDEVKFPGEIEPSVAVLERTSPMVPSELIVETTTPFTPPSPHTPVAPEVVPDVFSTSIADRQQIAFLTARRQELSAIHADLRARIRSENAEIRRIQSCIIHLLHNGDKRVRRMYDAHFAALRLHRPPRDQPLFDPDEASGLGSPGSDQVERRHHHHRGTITAAWDHNQSWIRMAMQLNTQLGAASVEHQTSSIRPTDAASIFMGDENDDLLACISHEENKTDHLVEGNEPMGACSAITTTALNNDDVTGSSASTASGQSLSVTYSRLNEEDTELLTHLDREAAGDDEDVEEEDEEEEEEGDETELARTLFQLTLDNARLVQLNTRYLEGIQAERNRCAELKVLLKLRHTGPTSHIQAPSPQSTIVTTNQPIQSSPGCH